MTAPAFSQLISRFLDMRFPSIYANSGDVVGLTIGTLREVERGGTAVLVLCVDLTEQVLAEAIAMHANAIVAYTPTFSEPMRSLRVEDPVGRIVLHCAQQHIAAFSLHTACANAPGGVADWLARALAIGSIRPIVPHADCPTAGEGRILECEEACPLSMIISRLKGLLDVRHLRMALGVVVDEQSLTKANDCCFIKSIAVQARCTPTPTPPRARRMQLLLIHLYDTSALDRSMASCARASLEPAALHI